MKNIKIFIVVFNHNIIVELIRISKSVTHQNLQSGFAAKVCKHNVAEIKYLKILQLYISLF